MKTILVFFLILLSSLGILNSQNTEDKVKIHKVWVKLMDGSNHKGFLYSADDEGIVISYNVSDTTSIRKFKANSIEIIKIRRKGSTGRGALYLGGTGALVGGGLGFASGDDPENQWFRADAEEKAGAGFVVGGVLGAGFGALFGSIKQKMIINGNYVNYMRDLTKLKSAQIHRE